MLRYTVYNESPADDKVIDFLESCGHIKGSNGPIAFELEPLDECTHLFTLILPDRTDYAFLLLPDDKYDIVILPAVPDESGSGKLDVKLETFSEAAETLDLIGGILNALVRQKYSPSTPPPAGIVPFPLQHPDL